VGAQNGHGLAGGRILGQPQQLALTEIRLVPALNISIVDGLGGTRFDGSHLLVADPTTGKALVCPLSRQAALSVIGVLQAYAQGEATLEGVESDGPVSE
jgi:hypothetical protein